MATPSQFKAEKVVRKYKSEDREVWRACWTDQRGNWKSKEHRRWRKKDAEEYARAKANEVRDGVFVADRESWTFAEAVKVWQHDLGEKNQDGRLSGRRLDISRTTAALHLVPTFGKLKCSEIDPLEVERWGRGLVVARELKPQTAKNYVNMVKLVLDTAVREGKLMRNQLRDSKLDLPLSVHVQRAMPNHSDMVALLNQWRYPYRRSCRDVFYSMRVFIHLVGYAGLRPNEACALQWENVDFDRREIHVRQGVSRRDGIRNIPKTRSGVRDVDMLPILQSELEDYAARSGRPDGFVLQNKNGGIWFPDQTAWTFRQCMVRAKLLGDDGKPRFSPHGLRHYAGSVWIDAGVSITKVSRMLGHASTEFTEKVYIHKLRQPDSLRHAESRAVHNHLAAAYRELGFSEIKLIEAPAAAIEAEVDDDEIELAEQPVNGQLVVIDQPLERPATTLAELRAQQRRRAVSLRDAGMQPKEIARELKMHVQTLHHWLVEHDLGIEADPRGVKTTRTAGERHEKCAQAATLAEQGLTPIEIAGQVGVPAATIRYWRSKGWQLSFASCYALQNRDKTV